MIYSTSPGSAKRVLVHFKLEVLKEQERKYLQKRVAIFDRTSSDNDKLLAVFD